jgi:hypothetical protein
LTPTDPPPPKATARQVPPPSHKASAGQGPSPNASPAQDPLDKAAAAHAAHHHDDHLYDDEFVHNEDVAHEHTDVNVRQLLLYTAGLVITCLVCAVIVWGLFIVFKRQAAANDPQLSPLAAPAGQVPPEPTLVTDEPAVLQKQRDLEAKMLEHYGWVDQKSGIARLPIDEAKKKLLHDARLPVRADASTDVWIGTRAAARGESSGGRDIPIVRATSDVRIQKLEAETKKPEQGTKPTVPRKPH